MSKKKLKLAKTEKVFYTIASVFAGLGIALAVLGIVGDHLNVAPADNWIATAENAVISALKVSIDFRGWGTILVAVGTLIAFFVLLKFAKKDDLEAEKAARRAQRLGS